MPKRPKHLLSYLHRPTRFPSEAAVGSSLVWTKSLYLSQVLATER